MRNAASGRPAPRYAPTGGVVVNAEFWKTWGDGQAELAGYDLTYPRYGQLRKGVAVTIFVSETFSNQLRVKADEGKHPASDRFPVMKLNLVQDFQTGIYDYNNMTSVFTALAAVEQTAASHSSRQELAVRVAGDPAERLAAVLAMAAGLREARRSVEPATA